MLFARQTPKLDDEFMSPTLAKNLRPAVARNLIKLQTRGGRRGRALNLAKLRKPIFQLCFCNKQSLASSLVNFLLGRKFNQSTKQNVPNKVPVTNWVEWKASSSPTVQ